jgi:hypothetical protein
VLHALGMAFLVGGSAVIAFRMLGLAPRIQPVTLTQLYPLLAVAFVVNLVSGLLLVAAYPTKALTNPLFYVKIALVLLALAAVWRLRNGLAEKRSAAAERSLRTLAGASLLLWVSVIFSGRFLAYTHTRLLVDLPVYF